MHQNAERANAEWQPDREADEPESHALANEPGDNPALARADGHAYRDLARALAHGEGHNGVEADSREEEDQQSRAAEPTRGVREYLANLEFLVGHGADVGDGQPRRSLAHGLANR